MIKETSNIGLRQDNTRYLPRKREKRKARRYVADELKTRDLDWDAKLHTCARLRWRLVIIAFLMSSGRDSLFIGELS